MDWGGRQGGTLLTLLALTLTLVAPIAAPSTATPLGSMNELLLSWHWALRRQCVL